LLNDQAGFKKIIAHVKSIGVALEDCLFCLEHTGVYSMPVCFFLQQLKLNYWMVAALEIKRSKGIVRGKSDKVDARSIAFYAITHLHCVQLTSLPEKNLLKMKVLLSEREKIVKAILVFETTQETTSFLPKEFTKEVFLVNKKTLSMLNKRLKEVDNLLHQLAQEETIKQTYELARSVPGVGQQTALYLIVYTRCFQSFSNWRKFACYSGIAPFEFTSGSSIRGRTKVNHMANKKLKSLISMAALSAKKYDRQLGEYYNRKVGEGKNPMLVMNAIRCKMISRVFATVKRGTPYVDTCKFAA
jgi:transposase